MCRHVDQQRLLEYAEAIKEVHYRNGVVLCKVGGLVDIIIIIAIVIVIEHMRCRERIMRETEKKKKKKKKMLRWSGLAKIPGMM